MAEGELVELIVLFSDTNKKLNRLLPSGPRKDAALKKIAEAKAEAFEIYKEEKYG